MEIKINNDIRKIKTKDIGIFSFREAGFIVVSGVIGYSINFIDKKLGIPFALEQCLLPCSIPLIFAFFKPFGMSFWKFLKTFFVEYFLSPQIYFWKSDYKIKEEDLKAIYGEEFFETLPYQPEIDDKKLYQKELKQLNSSQIR